MRGRDAMMSSVKHSWCTPNWVLELVREVFEPRRIGLDPCSNDGSIVMADTEWELERDGDSLAREWSGHGPVFVNPPYGEVIGAWVQKCRETGQGQDPVIALVPARVERPWFQDYCAPPRSDGVAFLRGRVKFLGGLNDAPFPAALVLWGSPRFRFEQVFRRRGNVWLA